jgi:regulator of sirC expression with transglutaminase-like and TPR domain
MSELTFYDEIQQSPINLVSAALRFSQAIAYLELNVDMYLELLDGLADLALKSVNITDQSRTNAEGLSDFLFGQLGFRGNTADYEDPRNSYLNDVLDRRLGIPISLSVIYIHLARKAGLSAEGVGLPGHFIVKIKDFEGDFYVDPFNQGRILSLQECAQLVTASTGYRGPIQEEWLEPAAPAVILTRMLNNLRNIYLQRQEWEHALKVIEHTSLLQPDMVELVRDRAIIYHQEGKLRQAVQNYERYLKLAPDAPDAPAIQTHLRAAGQRLARLN